LAARAHIAGWMAPDAGRPWFPIAGLTRVNVSVELSLENGFEITGKLAKHPETLRWFWWELRPNAKAYVILMPYRSPGKPAGTRHDRTPVAWRPLPGVLWPDPLPSPLTGPVPPPPAPPAEIEPPPLPEVDDWPYPGLRLGERVAPASEQECEARVLRALRRMDHEPRVGLYASRISADYPRELYHLMVRQQLAEDLAEALAAGRRITDAPDVRVAWTPTRRDNGDWDYALEWWRQLARADRALFRYRAANPSWSWRQIAEAEGQTVSALTGRYARAIARMFAIATKGEHG
jgi:hypothetical protein